MKELFKCKFYWCVILMCAAAVVWELSQGKFSTVLWICLSCFWLTKYLLEMENCYEKQLANIELCFQLTKTTGLLVKANDLLRKMEDELHKMEDKDGLFDDCRWWLLAKRGRSHRRNGGEVERGLQWLKNGMQL